MPLSVIIRLMMLLWLCIFLGTLAGWWGLMHCCTEHFFDSIPFSLAKLVLWLEMTITNTSSHIACRIKCIYQTHNEYGKLGEVRMKSIKKNFVIILNILRLWILIIFLALHHFTLCHWQYSFPTLMPSWLIRDYLYGALNNALFSFSLIPWVIVIMRLGDKQGYHTRRGVKRFCVLLCVWPLCD